jgi:hypothetical protein
MMVDIENFHGVSWELNTLAQAGEVPDCRLRDASLPYSVIPAAAQFQRSFIVEPKINRIPEESYPEWAKRPAERTFTRGEKAGALNR